jgi:hypothetical protein
MNMYALRMYSKENIAFDMFSSGATRQNNLLIDSYILLTKEISKSAVDIVYDLQF